MLDCALLPLRIERQAPHFDVENKLYYFNATHLVNPRARLIFC